jgi:hypothetical protein
MPICDLERQSTYDQYGQGLLALLLATAQSLEYRAFGDSQSRQRLTISIGNKKYKQIEKQYTKLYLMSKQIVPKDATHRYEHVSTKIN